MLGSVSPLDPDVCYRALVARDARFDGLFFVGRGDHGHLLPADLPGAHAGPRPLPVLPRRDAGRGGGLPLVLPLPARAGAGRRARGCAVARGRQRHAPHRRGRAVARRQRRRPGARAGRLGAPPAPRDAGRAGRQPAGPGRVAAAGAGAAAHRRHGAADDRGRVRQRLPQRAAVQRRGEGALRALAVDDAAGRARGRGAAPATR